MTQWIFIITMAFAFTLPLPFFNGKIGFFAFVLFILWFVEGKIQEKVKFFLSIRHIILFSLFFIYLLLALGFSDHLEKALRSILPFKYYLVIFLVIITSIPKEKLYSLIHAFIIGVVLFTILKLASEVITFLPYEKLHPHHSVYSPLVAFSALYYLNKLINNIPLNHTLKFFYMLLFILLSIGLFAYTGRSGKISFVFGILIILIRHKHHLFCNLLALFMGIFAIFLLSYTLSPVKDFHYQMQDNIRYKTEESIRSLKKITHDHIYEGSWGWRLGVWHLSGNIIKDNIIFGVGLGDGPDALQREIIRGKDQNFYSVTWMDGVHNMYVNIVLELGMIGLILFFLTLYILFSLPIKDKELKTLSLIFILFVMFNSISDEILFMKPYNNFFALMSAVFIASRDRQQT